MHASSTARIEDPQGFAGYVRELMSLAGIRTQRELAVNAGLSLNNVGNVLTAAKPSYRTRTLLDIARALGVRGEHFVWRAETCTEWERAAEEDYVLNRLPRGADGASRSTTISVRFLGEPGAVGEVTMLLDRFLETEVVSAADRLGVHLMVDRRR